MKGFNIKMKYSTIFCVALFVLSCSNQKIENDWTIENLKCKVKSYSEFSYKAEDRFGNIEKGRRKRNNILEYDFQNKYDEKGNQIESNSYNSDGSLDSKWTYKYEFDKQGNWVKRIDFEDGIPKFLLEREYEYYN